MSNSDIDDYLQQGIHGPKVTNPDERRQFLGTIRERIEVALTQGQVMEKMVYPEVEEEMKDHPKTHLFLNGHIDYRFLSKYIKKANQFKISFTIVTNNDYNSEIGLILAHKDAIEKENIFIEKKEQDPDASKGSDGTEQKEEKKGIFSFFKKSLE